MPEMAIMDPKAGDTKVIWDPSNADEVASAERTFKELLAKGFTAYNVKPKGGTGEIIRTFDPEAARLIMKPAFAGG